MDIPPTIGVSTAWNARRHSSGRAMIQELIDLGFDLVELNVHVTQEMIAEIADVVSEGKVRICSLHNYCPLPPKMDIEKAAMNALPLSHPNPGMRKMAVAHTKQTIDWAARLGARTVVLHPGHIPIESRQNEALRLIQDGKRDEAKSMIMHYLIERSLNRLPYMDGLMASLTELAPYAEDSGVMLGLETRYCYAEIPMLDEFQVLFKNVRSRALGYWHDTGHAHVMEVLGIANHEDFLKKYGDRLIGVHLHDAVGGSDHKAVGEGEIDFARILPYLKPDTQLVLEIHGHASADQLVKSREIAVEFLNSIETPMEAV